MSELFLFVELTQLDGSRIKVNWNQVVAVNEGTRFLAGEEVPCTCITTTASGGAFSVRQTIAEIWHEAG